MPGLVKIVYATFMLTLSLFAEYRSSISAINPQIKQRMTEGNSWKKGCPIPLKDLRYLRVKHIDFRGNEMMGEIIVHKDAAREVTEIFEELYIMDYPIKKMKLVSDYNGNDWQSIESDNTSAFNCRNATGSRQWSKHSYGKAVDINPTENPYISRSDHISHKDSSIYRKRVHQAPTYADKAILLKQDQVVQLFKKYGWEWGGDWPGVKDYQHFSK